MTEPADPRAWGHYLLTFGATALLLLAALYGLVLGLDPYGLRAAPGRAASPIMDLNQRYMYPQIVRGGRFDSAVFGTSTIRLLDPERLDAALGGRFANLGLNAGTPWEQLQLAGLFLRHAGKPRALVFGLDTTWCEPDADRKKLTFRAFPPWLYDESGHYDLAGLLNLTSLEIAGRVALNRLGLMPERIRQDGYERFVPDEGFYDLERARLHIRQQAVEAEAAYAAWPRRRDPAGVPMPALEWLAAFLARVPEGTSVLLATMPIHAALQAEPGSAAETLDRECKARIAAVARDRGGVFVDFRLRSPVTTNDVNYWDPLHYRVGIADRIVGSLKEALTSGRDAADGFYRVLSPPR
jgi:hypothetical protein